nr:MAG TPA_asm: ring finger containing protein [Caudoviricetes sp.]
MAPQSNLSFYPCKCPYQSSSWKSIFKQARGE